jgi:S1-C subfamily serine protease
MPPESPRFAFSKAKPIAALAAAALLGGGAALGGAAGLGAFDRTETIVQPTPAPAAQPKLGTSLPIAEIYRRSAPGVVQVNTTGQGGQAQGSGFVVDKSGHIVTNYHVIEGASEIEVSFSNQDTLSATLVGEDPSTDLAVLKVDENPRGLTPLHLGDSDKVQVGDPVVAIGNPFGLERTVTAGIVSALQRAVRAPNGFTIDQVIQTDAPINHGNSGGPLLDASGAVIGVNSQIETGGSSDGNVGIGFAVPSNTVESVIADILRDGKVDHAYLGVSARPVTPELASTMNLPVESGLLVETVTSGSGAEKAGLRSGDRPAIVGGESYRLGGDVIVTADGKSVSDIDGLRAIIAAKKPGDTLSLTIYRGQEKRSLTVTLGRQPASSGIPPG